MNIQYQFRALINITQVMVFIITSNSILRKILFAKVLSILWHVGNMFVSYSMLLANTPGLLIATWSAYYHMTLSIKIIYYIVRVKQIFLYIYTYPMEHNQIYRRPSNAQYFHTLIIGCLGWRQFLLHGTYKIMWEG